MKKNSVLVCDDHPIFREGLSRLVKEQKSLEIIGEYGDGKTAIQEIRELKPQMAVLDISIPEMGGIEVARLVQSENLPSKIIILTMYKEKVYFDKADGCRREGIFIKRECNK